MDLQSNASEVLQTFIESQHLPGHFPQVIANWYAPLAHQLAHQHAITNRPMLVAINGSQGSGKSTLASLLTLLLHHHGLRAIDLSIDDFYHTRQTRQSLAQRQHPLLATRGVPGTHDLTLLRETLQKLTGASNEVQIPRFDKSRDERFSQDNWPTLAAPLDIVILEGWCLGTPAQNDQALAQPVNELELHEDPDGSWRRYVNRQIGEHYASIYQLMNVWIMLQAPSFDCVYQWRLEQEQKLADRLRQNRQSDLSNSRVMSEQQLKRFIQHYQRLTEHSLQTLPSQVNFLYRLDSNRQITSAEQPRPLALT